MSAAMKAGFFLVILAGSFLPSAGQDNTTIAASSVTTAAPTTTVTTEAPTTTGSNSTNSTTTSPGGSNSTNSTTTSPEGSNSTNSTTTSPEGSNSTNSTTTSPGGSNSTNSTSPGGSNSTNSTTTSPEGSNSTNSTTTSPEDSSSVNPTDSTNAITVNPGVKSCETHPCGTTAATCTDISGGRICRCPYGYYYDEKDEICSTGKQFFGSLTVDVQYSLEFKNVMSQEYKWLYGNVTAFFILCFQNDTSYAETIITKITEGVKSRSLKATSKTTDIETISIFTASSTITQDNVTTIISNTINDTAGSFVTGFKKSSPCNSPLCDEATTTCNSTHSDTILFCDCKDGYYKRLFLSTSCLDCEVSCTVENKKECIQKEKKEGLVPACQCLISHKPSAKKDDPCVECDYGYSGVHCEDSFQLILIIVGSIAGALVLALLGGVITLSLKSKKADKSPDRERLIKPEDNAVFGSSQSTEVPQFPRVAVKPSTKTNNASTANPYEMDEPFQRTVPTRDYDDDTDSWFEMAPKNTAFGNNSKF